MTVKQLQEIGAKVNRCEKFLNSKFIFYKSMECPRFIVGIFSAHMNNKPKVTSEVNICGEVIFVLHSFVF